MASRTHMVCRPCRKVVKAHSGGSARCPHCGEPMANYGKRFHAPRRHDDRGWKLVDAWLARLDAARFWNLTEDEHRERYATAVMAPRRSRRVKGKIQAGRWW